MSIYRKKEDISKPLPPAFYLFGIETTLEAIRSSCFFGCDQSTYCSASENKNKIPAVDV